MIIAHRFLVACAILVTVLSPVFAQEFLDFVVDAPSAATMSEIESLRFELDELRQETKLRTVSSDELALPPIDLQRFNNTAVRGAEDFRGAIILPGTDVALRIDGFARFDAIYDTGLVETGISLFPGLVALDGTAEAGQRGQTTLSASQSRLSFDAQTNTEFGKLRGLIEMDFLTPGLRPRLRHVYGEWTVGDTTLLGGQTWTAFMDPGALPQAIPDTTASGAIFRRTPQLRYTVRRNELLTYAISLEESQPTDFQRPDPATDQLLKRWPDAIAQVRFANPEIGSLQIASLVRGLGYEDAAGDEHLRTA